MTLPPPVTSSPPNLTFTNLATRSSTLVLIFPGATDDQCFSAHFGNSAINIIMPKVSRIILNSSLLLEVEDGMISHMLWTLHFMKCYPKEKETCTDTSQSIKKGLVIDPKTKNLCNYVWSFIYVLSEQESEVLKMVLKIMFWHHLFDQMPSLNFVSFKFSAKK
jgi:hypothetical protein